MPNRNAEKGARWERATRKHLDTALGDRTVRRPHQEGYRDVGDLHVGPFALQCKDETTHRFSAYVAAAELQAAHAGLPLGAAVVKRRAKPTGAAYVVMSLDTFSRTLAMLPTLATDGGST